MRDQRNLCVSLHHIHSYQNNCDDIFITLIGVHGREGGFVFVYRCRIYIRKVVFALYDYRESAPLHQGAFRVRCVWGIINARVPHVQTPLRLFWRIACPERDMNDPINQIRLPFVYGLVCIESESIPDVFMVLWMIIWYLIHRDRMCITKSMFKCTSNLLQKNDVLI